MYYVIQVFSGDEEKIKKEIIKYLDKEIIKDVFIPKRIVRKKYQGSWHEDLDIIFKGYVFIESDKPDSINNELKKTESFTKLLGFNSDNNFVMPLFSEEERYLNLLLEREIDSLSDTSRLSTIEFQNGELVEILSGPLKNFKGNISSINLHKRKATVDILMFGVITPITLSFDIINKI